MRGLKREQKHNLPSVNNAAVVLRRELFQVWDSLGSEFTRVTNELKQATLTALSDVAVKLAQRVLSIETSVASLLATSEAETERTDLVTKYLEDLTAPVRKTGWRSWKASSNSTAR